MIVRKVEGRWVVIEQAEHARHSGEIAAAWARGPMGTLPPPLLTATRLHDIGWVEWDREPALDPATGGPANFPSVRDDRHSVFYDRGIRRVAEEDPYAGYLVSLHASGIYSGRYGWRGLEPIAWESIGAVGRQFLAAQSEFRRELLAGPLRDQPALAEFEATWSSYMLLQAFDYLSLLCCLGMETDGCWPVPFGPVWGRLRIKRTSDWSVALDPFPFDGSALDLDVTTRSLAQPRFSSDAELQVALAEAPPEHQVTSYQRL